MKFLLCLLLACGSSDIRPLDGEWFGSLSIDGATTTVGLTLGARGEISGQAVSLGEYTISGATAAAAGWLFRGAPAICLGYKPPNSCLATLEDGVLTGGEITGTMVFGAGPRAVRYELDLNRLH